VDELPSPNFQAHGVHIPELMKFNLLIDSPKSLFADSEEDTPSSLTRAVSLGRSTSMFSYPHELLERKDSRESWTFTPSELRMSPISQFQGIQPPSSPGTSITSGAENNVSTSIELTQSVSSSGVVVNNNVSIIQESHKADDSPLHSVVTQEVKSHGYNGHFIQTPEFFRGSSPPTSPKPKKLSSNSPKSHRSSVRYNVNTITSGYIQHLSSDSSSTHEVEAWSISKLPLLYTGTGKNDGKKCYCCCLIL